jgi:hypothetical protein
MRSVRRPRIMAVASVLALLAVLAATQLMAGAQIVPAPPAYAGPTLGAGFLRLHTGATNTFTFEKTPGTILNTDTLSNPKSAPKCELLLNGTRPGGATSSGALVTLQAKQQNTAGDPPADWFVGFTDAIGVGTGGEGSNGKCGQVNVPDQILRLALDNDTATDPLYRYYMDEAELDLEMKFDARASYSLYKDGAPVSGQQDIPLVTCADQASDCGPDSGDGDNYRKPIPDPSTLALDPVTSAPVAVLFDEIRFNISSTNVQAALSLEGGKDGTAFLQGGYADTALGDTKDSVFHLVRPADGILDCTDTVTVNDVELYRGQNKDGSTCVEVGYTLDRSGSSGTGTTVELLWDTTLQPYATFKVTALWDPEPDTYPVSRVTRIDTGTGLHTILWCDRTDWGAIGTIADAGGISATATSITVSETATPPTLPFDIVIGTERMTVSARSGSGPYTYTVTRHVGGTTAAAHPFGATVSTTVFPIDSSGKVDPGCLLSETSTVYSPTQVQATSVMWFEGDILMKH